MNSTNRGHLDPYEAAPKDLKVIFKALRTNPQSSEVLEFSNNDVPLQAIMSQERYKLALESFCTNTQVLTEWLQNDANVPKPNPGLVPKFEEMRLSPKPARTWDSRNSPSSLFNHLETYIRPQSLPQPVGPIPPYMLSRAGSAYRSTIIPGLFVLPSLLDSETQKNLLLRLLHRDLSDPRHQTNLHTHYDITYPPPCQSFFSLEDSVQVCHPKDPESHTSLNVGQVLSKKLKWMTLGGQYDWTKKVYPEGSVPPFPSDIAKLIRDLFPEVEPEAAIVNIYFPGDTLSLHRDVSEESSNGLVSISLGCDALFLAGVPNKERGGSKHVTIRVKSGDALYMTGDSRYAWHGVAKIFPSTCPAYLQDCPFGQYPKWMKDKRINISVRQMRNRFS